jgi:hypothetical protein
MRYNGKYNAIVGLPGRPGQGEILLRFLPDRGWFSTGHYASPHFTWFDGKGDEELEKVAAELRCEMANIPFGRR